MKIALDPQTPPRSPSPSVGQIALRTGLALLVATAGCNSNDTFAPSGAAGVTATGGDGTNPPPSGGGGTPTGSPTSGPTGTPGGVASGSPTGTPSGTPGPVGTPGGLPPGSGSVSCNPLNSTTGAIGVYATMKYLAPSQLNLDKTSPSYGFTTNGNAPASFADLWSSPFAQSSGTTFFFSNIDIENQSFSSGFSITDPSGKSSLLTYPGMSSGPSRGGKLKTDASVAQGQSVLNPGTSPAKPSPVRSKFSPVPALPLPSLSNLPDNLIVSYFGMQFMFNLQLPSGTADGAYDFQVASDDGAVIYVNGNSVTPYINNDGIHASVTKASTTPLNLSATKPTSFQINWFQGPPYFLQLILYYRPAGSGQPFVIVPANLFHLPSNAPGTVSSCPPGSTPPQVNPISPKPGVLSTE